MPSACSLLISRPQINSICGYYVIFVFCKTIACRNYFYKGKGYGVLAGEITFLSHFEKEIIRNE